MIFSKAIADHARATWDRKTMAFRFVYTIAVLVRIVELAAIVGLVWLFVTILLLAGQ